MAPAKELQQIVLNSDCVALILQDDKVLKALLDLENEETTTDLSFSQVGIFCLVEGVSFHQVLRNKIQFVVLLWGEKTFDTTNLNFPVFDFERALSVGRLQRTVYPSPLPEPKTDDVATIVYTSGTAGIPKGVVLTHRNILYQMEIIKKVLNLLPRNQFLSLLPPWHIYQRTISYYTFESGAHVVFGSVRTLSKDLVDHPSDVFVTVPLILQTLYKRVKTHLAKIFRQKRFLGDVRIGSISFQATHWIDVAKGIYGVRYCNACDPWKGYTLCLQASTSIDFFMLCISSFDLDAFSSFSSNPCSQVSSHPHFYNDRAI